MAVVALAACALLAASSGAFLMGAYLGGDGGERGARVAYTAHAPILIVGDAGFTPANGVTGGTGTASDPFIIENWEIDATGALAGIHIMGTTKHYVIRHGHVYGDDAYGVALYQAPHGTILESLFDSGALGVVAIESSHSNITGNIIVNQDLFGIEVAMSQWVNVTLNYCDMNNMIDIVTLNADHVAIADNSCKASNWSGIALLQSNYTAVTGNHALNSKYMGIGLEGCREAVITGNNMTANAAFGLIVGSSTSVTIHHNQFIGNGWGAHGFQALEDSSTDIAWDAGYPSGGNYWSDYTGDDLHNGLDQDLPGPDGIGDTPYYPERSGIDRYPWMTPGMEYIPEFGGALVPVLLVLCALPIVFNRMRRARTG